MAQSPRSPSNQSITFIRKTIGFADIDTVVTLGVVPIGAVVMDAGVIVSTAFNSATSDTLLIGTAADPNGFATLLDLTTAGKIVADELATSDDLGPYAAATTLNCTLAGTGTAPTAGSAEVYVTFIHDEDAQGIDGG